MNITITPALQEHMKRVGKPVIIVEVARSDSSDFEVVELHPHLISEKAVKGFVEKQNFRVFDVPAGRVLLPNYRLEYDDEVIFDLKKVLFFSLVRCQGIRL